MNESATKSYWKEILLVLIGGLLASVPTLVSTQMQEKARLKELILSPQIDALKEYSASYEKLGTKVSPKFDRFIQQVDNYKTRYGSKKEVPSRIIRKLRADFAEALGDYNQWIADVNTKTVVINMLFGQNLRLHSSVGYQQNDSTAAWVNRVPFSEFADSLEQRVANVLARSDSIQSDQHEIMRLLAARVVQK